MIRLRHGREPGHQREAFEAVIPEFGFAAEPVELDHREGEIETISLRLQHNLLVELEAWHVLRRRRRNDPAIVVDRNEDANVHLKTSLPKCISSSMRHCEPVLSDIHRITGL